MIVDVYKNLHKDCWSIRDHRTGLVVAHSLFVRLSGVVPTVQPGGRERVLRERKKFVHAWLTGDLEFYVPMDGEQRIESAVDMSGDRVFASYLQDQHFISEASLCTYNPYADSRFMVQRFLAPSGLRSVLYSAEAALMYSGCENYRQQIWLQGVR